MSEPMQIDEAVRVLNERRYRGASDWRIETRPDCRWDIIAGPGNPNCSLILESEDAITIAQGAEKMREAERESTKRGCQIRELEAENAQLKEDVEAGLQISGSFFEALKPLRLIAINVTDPGRHVTQLIDENAALRQLLERMSYYSEPSYEDEDDVEIIIRKPKKCGGKYIELPKKMLTNFGVDRDKEQWIDEYGQEWKKVQK